MAAVPRITASQLHRAAGEAENFLLPLLEELVGIVSKNGDSGAKLAQALECVGQRMGMTRGAITLVPPVAGDIHIEIAYGHKAAELSRGHYAPGEGITGLVIQSGKAVLVPDISHEPLFLNRTRSRNVHKDKSSFFCVALTVNDEAIGALSVERAPVEAAVGKELLRMLGVVACLLAPCAQEHRQAMDKSLPVSVASASGYPGMVGNAPGLQVVFAQMAQVAPSLTTVLVRGESGTGKELVAQAIHESSPRRGQPFISLNCAALPENLIESELFGHERGAFTGAAAARKGRFELAEGGTLFLDEVGDLSLVTQAKLLRALQERTFERLGGMETRKADVRIIAATHHSLENLVENGTFRRDLYYRLNVFPIHLPPLRDRKNDILLLANHFVERFAKANGKPSLRLSLTVMDMLHRYTWPGNIRELLNTMERAVLLVGKDGLILPQHLPPDMHSSACPACGTDRVAHAPLLASSVDVCTLQDRLDELERACIVEALTHCKGHLGKAAKELGLTERVMALRMQKYALKYQDYRSEI